MKAIVLGGGGIMGLSLLVYLKDQKEISEVLVTDIQENVVKERVAWLNDKKFLAKALDATDYNSLVESVKGYDVLLNTSGTRDKIVAMKAALEAGANYIDSGVEQEKKKLALSEQFKKKGLLAIFDMYYSPGLHNILAAYAIERLDRTDSVDFRWAVVDIVPPSDHSRQLYWGLRFGGYILHHFTRPSRRWENGKILELPPRDAPEMFTFKGPIGTTEVAGLPGDPLGSLAMLRPEVRYISFKQALGIEMQQKCALLAGLGFNKTEPINVSAQMVSPWEVLEALANNQPPETKKAPDIRHGGCAIVRGVKDGQKIEYRIDAWPSEDLVRKHKDMGCAKYGGHGGVFRCGSPMGSVAVLMARGQIKAKGSFFPEFTVPSEEFLKQEASMGINVEITKTVILRT